MGTRGSAEDRAREAADAAKILCTSWRQALDIPDGRVENTWENRLKVVRVLREQRPRVVILPYWKGRHPDHYTASVLGYEACFLAGLAKLDVEAGLSVAACDSPATATTLRAGRPQDSRRDAGATELPPHRPFKIIYATLYYDVRPTFVVDITEQFEARFEALMAYKITVQRSGSRQRNLPCPGRDSFADRGHGPLLRHAGWCDLCRTIYSEGSGIGGGLDADSGEVDLVCAAQFRRKESQYENQFSVGSSRFSVIF